MKSIPQRLEMIIKMEAYLINRFPSRRDTVNAYGYDGKGSQDLLFFYELNKKQVLIIAYNDYLDSAEDRVFDCFVGTYPNLHRWHRMYPERVQVVEMDMSLDDMCYIAGLLDSLDLSKS